MQSDYRTVSVRAVIKHNNSLLVEWFNPKQISFLPGGTVESNEDLKEALARELIEELSGITLSIGRYLGHIGHRWRTSNGIDSCLNHFYETSIISIDTPYAKEHGREVRWLPLNPKGLESLQPPTLRKLLLGEVINDSWSYLDSAI